MRVLSATSTIYLHVKQTEGTETANVSFDLGAATMEYGNNAPYFTWGRKDPMPPSTGMANANKLIYGTYSSVNNMNTTDIATTIRIPYYFNSSNGNPSLELWNVGNTSTTVNVDPVVKSIYDPSPAGFHLPCSGAFQGWDENGRTYGQTINAKQGIYVFQLGPAMGDAVFIPSLGWSAGFSSFAYVGSGGIYWSAGPYSNTSGRGLDSGPSFGANPTYENQRLYGWSCRPVIE